MKKELQISFGPTIRWVAPIICLIAGLGYAGTVDVVPGAAYDGGFGMRVTFSDTAPTYVRTDLPNDEARLRARFYFRLDGLSLPEGSSLRIFSANRTNDELQFDLVLERTGGQTLLSWSAREDGGTTLSAAPGEKMVVGAGYHSVEIDWSAAAGAGYLKLWYDGAFLPGLTGLDNGNGRVDYAMLGGLAGLIPGISGFIDVDDFQSQRICFIGTLNCDSRCQFDAMLPAWPGASMMHFIYFTNDACFASQP